MRVLRDLAIGLAPLVSVVSGAAFLFGWLVTREACASEPFAESSSPTGDYTAYVYQYDCGATTWFSTNVGVRRDGGGPPSARGNVLQIDGHPAATGVEVAWTGPNSLIVRAPLETGLYRQRERVQSILVKYEHVEPLSDPNVQPLPQKR